METKSIPLNDGSSLVLNKDSNLKVYDTYEEWKLEVGKSGAHSVVQDSDLPFMYALTRRRERLVGHWVTEKSYGTKFTRPSLFEQNRVELVEYL